MRLIYIVFERMKSHFRNHKAVIAMFLLGVFASTVFFTYFYGETVKATFADQVPELMSKYQIYSSEGFSYNDERILELEKENTVTFYYSFSFDTDKSSDIIAEGAEEMQSITCMARRTDEFDYENRFGYGDLRNRNSGIWLSDNARDYLDFEKLKNTDNPYLYINDNEMEIIGIHGMALDACIPFKYVEQNNIKAQRIEIEKSELFNEQEADEYAGYLAEVFSESDSVTTGYETFSSYVDAENARQTYNIQRAMLMLLLSVFTFMFLAKYSFDMSLREDLTYRILGAKRFNISLIAFGEVTVLAALSITAALITHRAFYDHLFGAISRYSTLNFTVGDYMLIGATALLTCLAACLPFVFLVWRKSAVSAKTLWE